MQPHLNGFEEQSLESDQQRLGSCLICGLHLPIIGEFLGATPSISTLPSNFVVLCGYQFCFVFCFVFLFLVEVILSKVNRGPCGSKVVHQGLGICAFNRNK